MFLQAKTKQPQPFFNRSTAKSIKSINSLTSNPEIQILVDRLQLIAEGFQQQNANPLNLVEWGRTKYRPSQSQNRIQIQNRVSLKKADNEKLRPRIKPIKRYAAYEAKQKEELQLSYKEHYREISTSLNKKLMNAEEESDEELPQHKQSRPTSSERLKYYDSIKKYTHLCSYLSDKITEKNTAKMNRKCTTSVKKVLSNSQSDRNEKSSNAVKIKSKTVAMNQIQSQLKIDSIIKKWNPQSRAQKRIAITEGKYAKTRPKSKEALDGASKVTSFGYSSERVKETSPEKLSFALTTKAK